MKKLTLILTLIFTNIFFVNAQWQKVYTSGQVINCLATNGTDIFAGTSGSGVLISLNAGVTWTTTNTGLGSAIVRAIAIKGSVMFAGTNSNGVYKSINNGSSWTAVNTGLSTINSLKILSFTVKGNDIFAGTDGAGVYLSSNDGASWSQINTGLSFNKVISLSTNGTDLYAGGLTGSGNGIYKSTNNGSNWSALTTGLSGSYSTVALTSTGSNVLMSTDAFSGSMYASTNNGASFVSAGIGITNKMVYALASSGGNIYAGVESGTSSNNGVFISTNNGVNFTSITTGSLVSAGVYALLVTATDIYAGTNANGIWKRPLNQIVTSLKEENNNSIKSSFAYPNPFNTQTTIVTQTELLNAKLKIYSTDGSELNSYDFNGTQITIDNTNMKNGMYFYRIINDSKIVSTGKLILE